MGRGDVGAKKAAGGFRNEMDMEWFSEIILYSDLLHNMYSTLTF